jgi:hypothetical protein
MSDPFYMYRLWNPEVRFAKRCLSWHNNMMMDKVKRLREQPPAPHTIAGQGVQHPGKLRVIPLEGTSYAGCQRGFNSLDVWRVCVDVL